MKKVLFALMLVCCTSMLYAKKDAGFQLIIDSQAVAGTNTIYSDPVLVGAYSDLSYVFTLHNTTVTADVKLEVQIIDSNRAAIGLGLTGNTTNQMVDPNFDVSYSTNNYDVQWVDLNSGGTLISSLTSGKIADGLSVPVTRYVRFKITGNAGNEATSGKVRVSLTIGRYSER